MRHPHIPSLSLRDRSLVAAMVIPLLLAVAAAAQEQPHSVPAIIEEIGKLEAVRDPKCYATASRLEDFIYGTPLGDEARFAKIDLQKALIRSLWLEASTSAAAKGADRIDAQALQPLLHLAVPRNAGADGSFEVRPGTPF